MPKIMQTEESKLIEAIRDVLMAADAIRCDIESYEPEQQYAKEHGYDVHYFPAEWKRYGKAAGYIRNTEMAKNADALVAFWDGASFGTKHMIATAEQLHLDVHVVRYKN